MSFYRFEAKNKGIYEAVDIHCPRTDERRTNKPDGSWLPKVGTKFPGAISFWTEFGLNKYLTSGLQEWHRSVVRDPLTVSKLSKPTRILYEDEFQIICEPNQPVVEFSWNEFCLSHPSIPTVDKVLAYITRESQRGTELLVFEHDKQWSEAGIQVPAGTVDKGEGPEDAVFREVKEEVGLDKIELVAKVDEYFMYRNTHEQFNNRHVYHLVVRDRIPDKWVHQVSGGGLDDGMNFHCYWLPLEQAELKLSGSMGVSAWKML